ncbi:hypothetical protein [Sphingomonas sp. 22176]|uniref:hypothetical protein n=1 Tax=Sphingomonas sp. 22176 TaxID=3453884 RepID=UPI003F873063
MELLAHRGFWRTPEEKNSEVAFRRAFAAGFGIETDVRDCDGELVVSHDAPLAGAMPFRHLLDIYREYPVPTKLALNIKADGLQTALERMLQEAGVTNYVVFDMSVPDLLGYRRAGMPYYVRRSEFEGPSSLDSQASGVWLDAFERPFADAAAIGEAAEAVAGEIALVSPELHRRPHLDAWASWRDIEHRHANPMLLCTDFPEEARAYFETRGRQHD